MTNLDPNTPSGNGAGSRHNLLKGVAIGLVLAGAGLFAAMEMGLIPQMTSHSMSQDKHGHDHGADGTEHDMVNMPGLRGANVKPEESAELATMFRNFNQITREVTNLDNGIRSVTYSADAALMAVVVSHVVGMIDRVKSGDDPEIIIQSPALDILFERRDRIETTIETTDAGIVVTQTSDDPEVITALHTRRRSQRQG